jgi:hypothetical protein
MQNPLTITIGDRTATLRPPSLIEAVGYLAVARGAEETDRLLVYLGVVVRHWPASSPAPWGDLPERPRESLADLGGRAIEAAFAKGYDADSVAVSAYDMVGYLHARVRPPAPEALKAAEDFSTAPTVSGTPPGASLPSDGSDPPSAGSI